MVPAGKTRIPGGVLRMEVSRCRIELRRSAAGRSFRSKPGRRSCRCAGRWPVSTTSGWRGHADNDSTMLGKPIIAQHRGPETFTVYTSPSMGVCAPGTGSASAGGSRGEGCHTITRFSRLSAFFEAYRVSGYPDRANAICWSAFPMRRLCPDHSPSWPASSPVPRRSPRTCGFTSSITAAFCAGLDPARVPLQKRRGRRHLTWFAPRCLIVHPKGTARYGTVASSPRPMPSRREKLRKKRGVGAIQKRRRRSNPQLLRRFGYRTQGHHRISPCRTIISSHTANANAFAGATWIVQKPERDAMFPEKPAAGTVTAAATTTRLSRTPARTKILHGEDYDVFGDGNGGDQGRLRTHARASGALRETDAHWARCFLAMGDLSSLSGRAPGRIKRPTI